MNIPAIGIGPLGSNEWSVGSVGSATGSGSSGGGGFGGALSNAINSLDATENNANQSAEGVATGQITDPTQAITAMENASLAMDYASQIRNQITTDATTIFQTQL